MRNRYFYIYLILLITISSTPIYQSESQQVGSVERVFTQISLEQENTNWKTEIYFYPENSTSIEFVFPNILKEVSTSIDGIPSPNRAVISEGETIITITPIQYILDGEIIQITIDAILEFELTATSKEALLFRYSHGLNYDIPVSDISVILPEYTSVSAEGEQLNIFPSDYSISSDGQRNTITWTNISLTQNNIRTLLVEFQYNRTEGNAEDNNLNPGLMILGIIVGMSIILLPLTVLLIYFKLTPMKAWQKLKLKEDGGMKIKTILKPVILKPHQRTILEILNENSDGLSQNDLVALSGLSKSRISQHLKELEELDIITREKIGRENMIYINAELDS